MGKGELMVGAISGSWVLIGVLVLAAILFIALYNNLVQKRIRFRAAWSQIDVQLKRRYDLIPNLVETVKGYAAHEKDTLTRVVDARNRAMSAGTMQEHAQAENMLTGALRQLFALAEAYPNLKANENFLQLQEELTSTENRIAFARQHYNDSTAIYNTARETFPGSMIAGLFHFQPQEYFEIDIPQQREAPKVQF